MPQLQWVFLEDDSPFPSHEQAGYETRPPQRLVALALLVVIATALVAWQSGQAGHRELRRHVEAQPGNVHVTAVHLRGSLAVVEVHRAAGNPDQPPLDATQFFLRADAGWRRVAPRPTFWGEHREQRTAHFHFLYSELDAGAVESLVPDVEALYAGLLQDLGLTQLPDRTYVIEIVPEEEPALHPRDPDWLRIASPHLRSRPSNRPLRDAVARRLADWLSTRLLSQRKVRPFMVSPDLRFMLDCLRQAAVNRWAPPDPSWQLARRQFVGQALTEGRWLDLSRFDYFLFDQRDRQRRTYQCTTVAEFIDEQYSTTGLAAVVQAAASQPSWPTAVETSLHVPYSEFHARWLAWVERLVA